MNITVPKTSESTDHHGQSCLNGRSERTPREAARHFTHLRSVQVESLNFQGMNRRPDLPGSGPLSASEQQNVAAIGCARQTLAAEAAEVLDEVRLAIERNPEAAHAAALRLVQYLTTPVKSGASTARGGLAPWQKRKLDRYLAQHLEHVLRLKDLADQVSLSVSHFCRAFKDSFGTTPHRYVYRKRVELARKLMVTTQEPLGQIALACGMSDQAHLSKLFRREMGETPTSWRRRHTTDARGEGSAG